MTKKVGNISRKEYTVFNTTNNISDNGKLFNIIEDLNDKGFMFRYNGRWITKDDCKHFLSDDTSGISIDLYHDVQGNSDKPSPKISKSVKKYPEQGEFVFDSKQIKSSLNFKKFTADDIFDSSRQITSAKSNWKQFIKGLDKLEKRDELKDMYNSAHWEFLNYIMPCDPEWTEDMADSDFEPLDEIYFLFKSPSDIESFLFECAKENLPGAREKLQRIRQIIGIKSSHQIKSSKSQEEFEDLVIDIENRLGVNVEHSNIFNLPAELTYEDECYIDDICREQNCRFVPVNGSRRQYRLIQSSRRNNMIKSSKQIKSSKYIVEVGDDSVEFDKLKEANETFRQAVENNDSNTTIKIYVDEGYSNKHLKLMDSERGRLNSSIIKSSYEDAFTVHPWDTNQVTGTSDEDLGLSYVVEAYGNEFVNVDDETLNDIRDKVLLRYFDDDAYVRDWNINSPDSPIESIYDIEDPEDLNNEELARYFDYEAYGRDLRLNNNMVWDSEEECWVSAHDVDDSELDNDKYIFMRG